MNDSPGTEPDINLTPQQFRTSWRIVTAAGVLGTFYFIVAILGAPRVRFLTELGAKAFEFGLLTGLSALALIFQVLAGVIVNHIRRRKVLWMVLAASHRLMLLGVVMVPVLIEDNTLRIAWVIGIFVAHEALSHLGAPIWFSWMADLVPSDSFNRHWGARQRVTISCAIVLSLATVVVFDWFEGQGRVIEGYMLLASIACLCGVIDILMFIFVPEPRLDRNEGLTLGRTILQPLHDQKFLPFLRFMLVWHFAAMIAAPFFTLYLIDEMGLSVLWVQVLISLNQIGVVLTSRLGGVICDNFGQRPALIMAVAGKSLITLAFLTLPTVKSAALPILAVVFFVDGLMNGIFMLASMGSIVKLSPKSGRTMYVAVTNFLCIGLIGGLTPIASGALIDWLNTFVNFEGAAFRFTGFHVIFLFSIAMRLITITVARKIEEDGSLSTRVVLRELSRIAPWRLMRLLSILGHASRPGRRAAAARRLARIGSTAAIRDLIGALEDEDLRVRVAAADALGHIGATAAAPSLSLALAQPEHVMQFRAVRALGRIADEPSRQALLHNLTALQPHARREAAVALGMHGEWDAVLPLLQLLQSEDDVSTRSAIIEALRRIGHFETAEELFGLAPSTQGPAPIRER